MALQPSVGAVEQYDFPRHEAGARSSVSRLRAETEKSPRTRSNELPSPRESLTLTGKKLSNCAKCPEISPSSP